MDKKIIIRRFMEPDAEAVQNIIHRGLREVNGKEYPAELIGEFCRCFTLEKIQRQAESAHMYVEGLPAKPIIDILLEVNGFCTGNHTETCHGLRIYGHGRNFGS